VVRGLLSFCASTCLFFDGSYYELAIDLTTLPTVDSGRSVARLAPLRPKPEDVGTP
jgi:hypothetical protein